MNDRPEWLTVTPKPDSGRGDTFRRVASLLVGGAGLVILVPPVYMSILEWRRNGVEVLAAGLPCCSVLAAPFFVGAWRIRNGPLSARQQVILSQLSTALLILLFLVTAFLTYLLISFS